MRTYPFLDFVPAWVFLGILAAAFLVGGLRHSFRRFRDWLLPVAGLAYAYLAYSPAADTTTFGVVAGVVALLAICGYGMAYAMKWRPET